jgi:DNA-binding HxlR family transcriptional regulator
MSEDISRNIKRYNKDLSIIFNAIGHEKRLLALGSLIDGEKSLQFLMRVTKMSKNGLVNHLNVLMEAGLVKRVSRGKYSLTLDGEHYLTDAVDQYMVSEKYVKQKRQIESEMYRLMEIKVKEKKVDNQAEYQACWFSYPGAVTGVLKSLGKKVDLVDIYGVSGYGWVTNAMKRNLCPSAPSAFHREVWNEIYNATEDLGYKVDIYSNSQGFSLDENQKPTAESIVNARTMFNQVKVEIDRNRPVVLWGIVIPEYGIVNGYRDEYYIVSTFRRSIGQPDDPVHYTGLVPPGGLVAIMFKDENQIDPKEVAIKSLKRGLKLASGKVPNIQDYVIGIQAYDVLVKNLMEEPHDENSYHGFSYTIACLQESKWGISEYLKRLENTLEVDLRPVIEPYERVFDLIKECQKLSPFAMKGKLDPEVCQNSTNLLKSGKEYEAQALKSLSSIVTKL